MFDDTDEDFESDVNDDEDFENDLLDDMIDVEAYLTDEFNIAEFTAIPKNTIG